MPASDILAAFKWWLAISLIGMAAYPFTFVLLKRLPDRGYAFTKMVGLLIVSFVFWLSASLGFVGNDSGGISLALLCLIAASAWAYRKRVSASQDGPSTSAGRWLRSEWKYLLLAELVFALAFVFWTWVRSQNPAITATEKPMELAFLNSAGRSAVYPPIDPWLSGFSISYYYFGYVMTSIIGRLAMVPESIGFNLAVAWLAAGTAVGAFGIVYNLSMLGRSLRRQAMILGIVASIALPVAGNMEILLELLHGNGLGNDQMWEWLDVRDLGAPAIDLEEPRYERSNWWWWRSSRVIHEYHLSGQVEESLEPIAEFPGFSFVLGDLHPHVLALPFAFLGMAVALSWWLWRDPPRFGWINRRNRDSLDSTSNRFSTSDLPFLLFTALVLGGLSFLNTWDVLIYLFVITGAYALSLWRRDGKLDRSIITQTVAVAAGLTIIAVLLYLPFYLGFRSQAGPPFILPMVMRPTRLVHFLTIFIMPLSATVFLLLLTALRVRKTIERSVFRRTALKSAAIVAGLIGLLLLLMLGLGLIISLSPEGSNRISVLVQELDLELPALDQTGGRLSQFSWALKAIGALLPQFVNVRLEYMALTLFLAILITATIFILFNINDRNFRDIRRQNYISDTSLPFVLLLIFTGLLLVLGTEFVYLRDNFGQRVNTVFKFYYQAWVLFGVAALVSLNHILNTSRGAGTIVSLIYLSLLIVALFFPFHAISSRAIEYRGPTSSEDRMPATLDGLDYLKHFNPDEFEAIKWLQDEASSTTNIVEALGGQYSSYGRVSSITGIPTLLGWAGHEYQWRGSTPEPSERETAIDVIYSQSNWLLTADFLNHYEIDYIYYGSLEKSTYGLEASEKFYDELEVAFENDGVTIFHWLPNAN